MHPWVQATIDQPEFTTIENAWKAWFLGDMTKVPNDLDHPHMAGPIGRSLTGSSATRCILRMLHPNPDVRCSINDVLHDSFMARVECCSPMTKWTQCQKSARGGRSVRKEIVHNHMPPKKPIHERVLPKFLQYSFDLGHYSFID